MRHQNIPARLCRRVAAAAAAFMLLAFSAVPLTAHAQAVQADAAGMAAVRNFTLTEAFLGKVEAITREGRAAHIQSKVDPTGVNSLADMAARIDAVPEIHALLARHNISASEYLTGTMALASAAMAAAMAQDPAMAGQVDAAAINADNLRFYQQHQARIDALLQAGAP